MGKSGEWLVTFPFKEQRSAFSCNQLVSGRREVWKSFQGVTLKFGGRRWMDGWMDGDEKTREVHYGSSNRYYR
jgi:hypothetical protein